MTTLDLGTQKVLEDIKRGLLKAQHKVVVAESCTSGMIGSLLGALPGSSGFFLGGIICYHPDLKESFLGVSKKLILEKGEVSEEVALALSLGALLKTGAQWAVSATGYAGPQSGASSGTQNGTVYAGIVGPSIKEVVHFKVEASNDQSGRLYRQEQFAKKIITSLRDQIIKTYI